VDRDRERDREARFAAEARFRAVFEHAPVGQVFSGMDGRITSVNEPLARMLGYTVEQMTGRPSLDFICPADQDAVRDDAARLRAGHAARTSAMLRFLHREGHDVPVRVVSALLPGAGGEPAWWVSMVVDLSEEERARTEVDRARASAERSADRLQLLHAVATAANEAQTLDELAPHVLDAVCERFGWPAGALVRWAAGTRATARHLHGPAAARRLTAAVARLEAPVADEPMLVYAEQPLVVVPLASSGPDRFALVFAGPVDAFDERQREVLALVGGECRRVIERESAERRRRQDEARFRTVFDASPLPMGLTVGDTGTYSAVNEALCRLLGRTREELVGASVRQILHPDDIPLADPAGAAAAAAPDGRHCVEMRLLHSSGTVVTALVTLAWMDGSDGSRLLLAQMEDITARRAAEEALRRQAEHDSLTGLANRFHLSRVLGEMGGERVNCAILFIDLDGFKLINDTRGHDVGDEVLVEVAARLRDATGPGDLVARFGGDEFVVVCRAGDAGRARAAARRAADRIESVLAEPVTTSSGTTHITASIGISDGAVAPGAPQDLLQRADTAMYHAKRLGKDRRAVYDAGLHERTVEYQRTEAILRDALDEHRFVVHYQPIVDIADASIVGFEALVRLLDADGQIVPPGRFIAVAEQSGVIVPMGAWVLAESCRTVAALSRRAGRPLSVSVNVAARQAARSDLADTVTAALTAADLPPSALTLELTESALLDADETTLRQLTELRERGVYIGLDDFGTGYSSLTYLRRFPVSHIKVDRSFVTDMTTDGGNAAIVRAVTTLASDLGLFWVAEGIETDEQWRAVQALGPGFAQGYLFSRPLPAEVLDHILRIGQSAPLVGFGPPVTR
jgi:diguanylate cyclase (GGDEF)-like protein/PAS domain S-box-containing protein